MRISKVNTLGPPALKHGARLDVADIGSMIHSLSAKGVAFERFSGMQQDAIGVWVSPSGAKVAWFKNHHGNVLSLTQFS